MFQLQPILATLLMLLISTSAALQDNHTALTKRHESAKPLLRIMPLGASITTGFSPSLIPSHQSGYRLPLRNILTSHYLVNFLGTQANGNFSDNQHEGYPGLEINQVVSKALPNVAKLKPNFVLILLGTNDCLHGRGRGDMQYAITARDRMERLVEGIFGVVPGVMVIVASLPPTRNKDDMEYLIAANRGYEALVREMRARGKKIAGVDMWNVAWEDDEWSDAVHFNDKGYARMATVWAKLLKGAVVSDSGIVA